MANIALSDPSAAGFVIMQAVFPVAAVAEQQSGELVRPDFFGTAFAIAPGVFLTAWHVIREAQAAGRPVLTGPTGEDRPLGTALIHAVEACPDRDIAVLYCGLVDGVTFFDHWMATRVQPLEDLAAFGYPHAITRNDDELRLDVVFRAYKGHVITTRGFERLSKRPAVYEVSSPFPVGMSGSPALWTHGGVPFVVGMVLGESTVEYGGVSNRVGIVLAVDQFGGFFSPRLGKRLGELVKTVGAEYVPEQ